MLNVELQLELAELRAEKERLLKITALERANGLHFYRPHAKQDKFHAAALHTGRYCRTGNRGGKTKCGAAEDIAYCIGHRPWYKSAFPVYGARINEFGRRETFVYREHPGGENHPLVTLGIPQRPVKLLLIVADWDKSKEIFTNNEGDYDMWGDLFQLIPQDLIDGIHKSRGGHIDRIDLKRPAAYGGGTSSIYIDTVESYKHAKMSMESSDWDAIHVDEPCPQQMFTAVRRGLVDRKGKFWFNCTPIMEAWMNDEFIPEKAHMVAEAKDGLSISRKVGKSQTEVTRFIITWSSYDNPHNSEEALAEFEAGLSPEEKQCRIEGLPLSMAGLVYPEFRWDEHVMSELPKGWDDWHLPPKDHTIRVWWDVHIRLPQAVLYFATAPDGRVYVYNEQYYESLIGPNANLLTDNLEGYFCVSKEIDPAALVENPVDETSIQDTLIDYGHYFEPATKDRTRGTLLTKQKLKERGHDERPTILFSPKLTRTLWEISRYVYDPTTNKPVDKDDHMMENLYRAILSGLHYVEPPSDEDYTVRRTLTIGFDEASKPLSRR